MSITKIPKFGKAVASYVKNKFNKKDPTISSVKTKINKTKLDNANSTLAIAKQKLKAGKAKLDQTVFEIKNKMPITFKSNKGKSESNTESYKRITGENNKVIKGMLDKAAGKK